MLIYRLCKQRYSAAVLSGAGGIHADGRWHSQGNPIVYCATSESLAVLELRVHTGNYLPHHDYAMHEIELQESDISELEPERLPKGWNAVPHSRASQKVGDAWLAANTSLALRVPSVHSSTEFNVLLNPLHSRHSTLKLKRHWRYRFDARLFVVKGQK